MLLIMNIGYCEPIDEVQFPSLILTWKKKELYKFSPTKDTLELLLKYKDHIDNVIPDCIDRIIILSGLPSSHGFSIIDLPTLCQTEHLEDWCIVGCSWCNDRNSILILRFDSTSEEIPTGLFRLYEYNMNTKNSKSITSLTSDYNQPASNPIICGDNILFTINGLVYLVEPLNGVTTIITKGESVFRIDDEKFGLITLNDTKERKVFKSHRIQTKEENILFTIDFAWNSCCYIPKTQSYYFCATENVKWVKNPGFFLYLWSPEIGKPKKTKLRLNYSFEACP